jgi:hypothetical protein
MDAAGKEDVHRPKQLRELSLERNAMRSLAPLSALSGLQVLRAAHNHLASCMGVEVRVGCWQRMHASPAARSCRHFEGGG